VEESGVESEAESNPSDGDQGGDEDSGDELETSSEGEEETIDDLLDAGGAEPKVMEDIQGWQELREQIKSDLELAEKSKSSLSKITQLLILRNFATLRIKGCGRMAASEDIARQWREGKGAHFAR